MKKKPGRPVGWRKPSPLPTKPTIAIRVTRSEKAAIEKIAAEKEQSVSEFCRVAILAVVPKE